MEARRRNGKACCIAGVNPSRRQPSAPRLAQPSGAKRNRVQACRQGRLPARQCRRRKARLRAALARLDPCDLGAQVGRHAGDLRRLDVERIQALAEDRRFRSGVIPSERSSSLSVPISRRVKPSDCASLTSRAISRSALVNTWYGVGATPRPFLRLEQAALHVEPHRVGWKSAARANSEMNIGTH